MFHDLRWLLVYHSSWIAFVLEWLVFVNVRAVLDVVLTRAAWPDGQRLPDFRRHLLDTHLFVTVQALVLLPFAVLVFAMAVTSLSWLFFVAIPVLVMIAVLVHHGAVTRWWWRDRPSRISVKMTLTTFAVLTVDGAVISAVPSWAQVLLAACTGAAIAMLRIRMVGDLAGREVVPSRRPFALVGFAAVLALVLVGTAAGFGIAVAVESGRTPLPRVRADAAGPPVLVVTGFNSQWDGVTRRWVRGRVRIRKFSYRGLDAHDRPRSYDRQDTHRSIRALVLEMRAQVAAFHRSAGARVSIVAESEGALVAQAYLASTPNAPVRAIVLLSPLVEPGRVHYPDLPGGGWGVASGTILDGIATVVSWLGPVDVSSGTPLFRSIVDEEPALGRLLACPSPGVRSFAVVPIDSGVSAPAPFDIGYAHAFVPAFHGGLLGDGTTQDYIHDVLRGQDPGGSGFWQGVADVTNAGAAAWQAPSLERDLEPRWDSRPGAAGCAHVRAELTAWVD